MVNAIGGEGYRTLWPAAPLVAAAVERARFIALVRQALRDVPPPFKEHLRQIDIVVKRRPSRADLARRRPRARTSRCTASTAASR